MDDKAIDNEIDSADMSGESVDSRDRFSNRVEMYIKYRPSYPQSAIDYLYHEVGCSDESVIADVGAGTGILSKLLLNRGSAVIAIEPNVAMREHLQVTMGDVAKCRVVDGTAEATGLADDCVDFIVCAQSFHWFNRDDAKREFHRIVKPGGSVVVIWNARLTKGTPFLEGYERLLQMYGTDYNAVNHTNVTAKSMSSFFKEGTMREARFAMSQSFDLEGLRGRLLSSSYTPLPGHASYEPMLQRLQTLFEQTHQDGQVSFDYETQMYVGTV